MRRMPVNWRLSIRRYAELFRARAEVSAPAGLTFARYGGVEVGRFPVLSALGGLDHFVTTRRGGCSRGLFDGLNLGATVGDDPAAVASNRAALAAAMGLPDEALLFMNQVHGCTVRVVAAGAPPSAAADNPARRPAAGAPPSAASDNPARQPAAGAPPSAPSDNPARQPAIGATQSVPPSDALVTNVPGVCLTVLVADCAPVLAVDSVRNVVGVAHAGWRGTCHNVVGAMLRAMHDHCGARIADTHVAIGPCIGPHDYEVGPEVVAAVTQSLAQAAPQVLAQSKRPLHAYFNLPLANALQARMAGVSPERVHIAQISTVAAPERFYSYRRDGVTGRFAAGVWLRAGV